jgi:hypothetical protein
MVNRESELVAGVVAAQEHGHCANSRDQAAYIIERECWRCGRGVDVRRAGHAGCGIGTGAGVGRAIFCDGDGDRGSEGRVAVTPVRFARMRRHPEKAVGDSDRRGRSVCSDL